MQQQLSVTSNKQGTPRSHRRVSRMDSQDMTLPKRSTIRNIDESMWHIFGLLLKSIFVQVGLWEELKICAYYLLLNVVNP